MEAKADHFLRWISRVPKRDAVPYRVLFLPYTDSIPSSQEAVAADVIAAHTSGAIHHPASAVTTVAPCGMKSFIDYIVSDDTRFPHHPALDVKASDDVEYDTYVGEDYWKNEQASDERKASFDDGAAVDDDDSVDFRKNVTSEQLAFLVRYFQDMVKALNEGTLRAAPDYGVAVGGTYGIADDATWAVPSNTVGCRCAREIFSVLRSSTKLICDIETQVAFFSAKDVPDAFPGVFLILRKHIDVNLSLFYRVFGRKKSAAARASAITDEQPSLEVLGVAQFHTDQVFDNLADMTREQNAVMYANLERFVCEHAFFCTPATTLLVGQEEAKCEGRYVDILYEKSSLPYFVLDVGCIEASQEKQKLSEAVASSSADAGGGTRQELHKFTTAQEETSVSAFRLFGSYANLIEHHEHALRDLADNNFPRTVYVASEHDHLYADTCAMMSGVPLELQHPEQFKGAEALSGNEELKQMYLQLLERMATKT